MYLRGVGRCRKAAIRVEYNVDGRWLVLCRAFNRLIGKDTQRGPRVLSTGSYVMETELSCASPVTFLPHKYAMTKTAADTGTQAKL